MNHSGSRTHSKAVALIPPVTDAGSSAPTPGTRDACPTKETSSFRTGLRGSRLGCRAGGSIELDVPCRPADNPFASHRIEGLAYRTNEFEVASLCRRLENLRDRAAIVGPKGSGKTTLLEELATSLPGQMVRVRIEASSRRPWRSARAQLPKTITPNHVVLVDGAEQLGPLGWRLLLRATRRARTFIATLHHPGRLPTLIECRTDHGLLCDLVEELAPVDAPALVPDLEGLFRRHRGDIRMCFRELYDVYAGRSDVTP
jgi:hypothetical protein